MMRRRAVPVRVGRPSLIGTMATTAVVVGTAGAVSGHQQQKQMNKQMAAQEQQQQEMAAQQAAAAPAAPATTAGGASVTDQLTQLAQMKSQGLLSDQEFEAAKVKLLGS